MAASKTVSVALSLQDKYTAPMKNATNATKNYQKAAKLASVSLGDLGKKLGNAALSAGKAALAFTAVTAAASVVALKKFGDECIEAAKDAQKIGTELETALSNVNSLAAGGQSAISAAKDELSAFATELQKSGIIGDDETMAGMSQLATFGMDVDTIKTLSTAMDDIVAKQYGFEASADNVKSIATALGKAMNGSYTTLNKMGIVISDSDKKLLDSLDSYQRAAKLAEIIEDHVGGANEALANTDEGKLKQFSNMWGDMQENLGAPLLAAKASLASVATEFLPDIESTLTNIFNGVAAGMTKAGEFIRQNKEGVSEIFKVLNGVVTTVGNGIVNGFKNVNISTERFGYLLDAVKGAANVLANVLSVAIPLALEVITGLAEGIYGIVTLIVDALKWVADHLEQLGDTITEVLGTPTDGNYSHASMGENALGTPYFAGGLTRVNERGGEIMNLPSGTQIIPHDISEKMASGTNVSLNLTIQGNVIGNQEYAEELGSYITNKVVMALGVV